MATASEQYEERLDRILKAVRMEKTDRIPVVPLGDSFCARQQGVKMSEFATKPEFSNKVMLDSFESLGGVDGIQHVSLYAYGLSTIWFSRLKIPGKELPDDEIWQVDEQELMTVEDYDAIVKDGFRSFREKYYREKLDDLDAKMAINIEVYPKMLQNAVERGVVPFSPAIVTIPYEMFCGGRSMAKFLKDLYRIPDKVQAAMDAAMPVIIEDARMLCRNARLTAIWAGGWRAASEFISPKHWQKFVLPYYKQLVEAIVEEGTIAVLHFDSSWTRDLQYLREFPSRKCVFSPDGRTDIWKAKEILGDHLCIMGDVPAAMLTLGTVDDVKGYCRKLIEKLGPTGYIMAQGCDIPPDAKPENVEAMIASVK